jgi:hypothetical protein
MRISKENSARVGAGKGSKVVIHLRLNGLEDVKVGLSNVEFEAIRASDPIEALRTIIKKAPQLSENREAISLILQRIGAGNYMVRDEEG